MTLPKPLTEPGLDLRDFDWMPLQVARLRDSNIVVVASGEAFRAAVLLWCSAWHQVPAASLPKDERMLASLAGFGRDLKSWKTVSADALHGFIECADGRLYHPVIAEKAIEADGKRRVQRKRTEAATSARRNGKRDVDRDDARNDHQETGQDITGPEKTEEKKRGSHPPSKNFDVIEGRAVPIDEAYVPSPRAEEYAYSLGMKRADLAAELSKFIALSMATRAVAFDIDAKFKIWCDRWLEFKRKDNPDWKPAPEPAAPLPKVLIVEGTLEERCWQQYMRDTTGRPMFICTQINNQGREVRGALKETLFPPGYDEATGEKIAPANAEDAA